jgi:hypothetical protein
VSVEAICWALNLAPVPADRGGQPSSACKFVLVGLANHAGPDGTGAFPSVATLVRYTGLSERTLCTRLDRLAAEGIISACDPDIVAARIKRADRRPQGWDLNLTLVRHDLDDAALAVLEHQLSSRGWASGSPRPRSRALTARLAGCTHRTPLPPAARLWITGPAGFSRCTPSRGRGATCAVTGCSSCTRTIQGTVPRTVRRPPRGRQARPAAGPPVGGGGRAGEFFGALGAVDDQCRCLGGGTQNYLILSPGQASLVSAVPRAFAALPALGCWVAGLPGCHGVFRWPTMELCEAIRPRTGGRPGAGVPRSGAGAGGAGWAGAGAGRAEAAGGAGVAAGGRGAGGSGGAAG